MWAVHFQSSPLSQPFPLPLPFSLVRIMSHLPDPSLRATVIISQVLNFFFLGGVALGAAWLPWLSPIESDSIYHDLIWQLWCHLFSADCSWVRSSTPVSIGCLYTAGACRRHNSAVSFVKLTGSTSATCATANRGPQAYCQSTVKAWREFDDD
jgi:hypothetical protein